MTRRWHIALLGACLALPFQPGSLAAVSARTAVTIADDVIVRGRPEPRSEIILQLSKGRRVTVLEDVPGPRLDGSEALWSRIALPSGTPVWVFGDFVDPATGEVTVRLLNMRAGKGEAHVIVGVLLKGERVEQLRREGDWLEVKSPIGAYGYVAGEYLETVKLRGGDPGSALEPTVPLASEGAGTVAPESDLPGEADSANQKPLPVAAGEERAGPPATDPSPEAAAAPAEPLLSATAAVAGERPGEDVAPAPAGPVIAASVLSAPAEEPATARTTGAPAEPAGSVAVEAIIPVDSRPAPPVPRRIAIREGIVKRTLSIQAPGEFELRHSATGDRLVYLYAADPKIDIKRFHRRRVRVRGEEFIDPRWPNCAVLFVERITLAP